VEDAVIKFNESRLPEASREKLLSLDSRRVEEAAAAAARLPYEITDQKITERVRASQDRHRLRHDEIHALCTHVRQWLASLPADAALEPAPPVNARPIKGETVAQAIERLRDEIAAASQHLLTVKRAPPTRSELKASAALLVKQLAARGRPTVSAGSNGLAVAFAPLRGDTVAHYDEFASLVAFVASDLLTRALEKEIDALPQEQTPMPKAEQDKRASELAEQLLGLERIEEALIDSAQAQGQDIARRENASPAAVLGIVVAVKAKALEAA
jgi:hypothetical protein